MCRAPLLILLAVAVLSACGDGDSEALPQAQADDPVCSLLSPGEVEGILGDAVEGRRAPAQRAPADVPSCLWENADGDQIAMAVLPGAQFATDLRQMSEGNPSQELAGVGDEAHFISAPPEAAPEIVRLVGAATLMVLVGDEYLFAVVNTRDDAAAILELAPEIGGRFVSFVASE